MDPATAMGAAVIAGRRGAPRVCFAACLLCCAAWTEAVADQRFALIVSGASGGATYVENYDRRRAGFVSAFRGVLRFEEGNIIVLAESAGPGVGRASREGVRRAVETLRARMTPQALLFVALIGHGTYDGIDGKFSLVGPDLTAAEWADLLRDLPGRLVVVNMTSASFPFLERLAAPDRIVITATDSTAQRFETVFPDFFVQAFSDSGSDSDKDGRISVWEAFMFTAYRVRQWYEGRGQLSTERALLDDTGDGVGKDAGGTGPDGAVARRTFLDPSVETDRISDPILASLLEHRRALEAQVEALKARRELMPAAEYKRELERLLIELARVSKQIRSRS